MIDSRSAAPGTVAEVEEGEFGQGESDPRPASRLRDRGRKLLLIGTAVILLLGVTALALKQAEEPSNTPASRDRERHSTATPTTSPQAEAPEEEGGGSSPSPAVGRPAPVAAVPSHSLGQDTGAVRAVRNVPTEVAADCSRDVARELNEWIGSAPNGTTLVFGRGACYRVETQLTVEDKSDLILEGNGATLRSLDPVNLNAATNGGGAILQINRGRNHQVLDLKLVGSHPDHDDFNPNAAHLPGIRVRGADTLLFDRISVSFVWGDFIELKANIATEPRNLPSRNVTIRNSHFNRAGRQGINISGAENVLFEGNTVRNAHFSAIDQEGVQGISIARGITIRNNDIYGPDMDKFITSTHKTPTRGDWRVLDNRLHDVALEIVFYTGADNPMKNLEITGNTSDTPGGTAIRLYSVHNAEVRGNSASLRKDRVAVELQSVATALIRDNVFKGAAELLAVDRGVWKEEPYEGPPSTGYRTCNNVTSRTGESPPSDQPCA